MFGCLSLGETQIESSERNVTILDLYDNTPQLIALSDTAPGLNIFVRAGNDSLVISRYNGITNFSVHDQYFLEIVYYTPSGSDFSSWRRSIICISQGKLHVALTIKSDEKAGVGRIFIGQGYVLPTYERDDYHVTVDIQSLKTGCFTAILHECREYQSAEYPEENESWEETFKLRFDTAQLIFYNTIFSVNDSFTIASWGNPDTVQYIHQDVQCIDLSIGRYCFINGEWYAINLESSKLYR